MFVSIYDTVMGGSKEAFSPENLGGKGYGLWDMQQAGVNVPPALIIPPSVCVEYMKNPTWVLNRVKDEIDHIKKFFTDKLGYMPLVSVRSGARVSMPGMMDTILNVGLDKTTYSEWSNKLGEACAKDSYKRLVTMFGSVVNGIDRHALEKGTFEDTFHVWQKATGNETWLSTDEQIVQSVKAVFDSWMNERAKVYRKLNNIPETWGTAVVIQAMVFGNLNDNSGTGVLFTRNPDTGENVVVGEFLTNAQGEDVVAGIRTPMPLSKMPAWNKAVADELMTTVEKLETVRKDVQDVEFTIQDGKLYILQTRNAKRSARAAVKIARDMFQEEGLIDWKTACKRVSAKDLDLADQPVLDPTFKDDPAFTGLPACSGVVTGRPVFTAIEAVEAAAKGEQVILITKETTPDDIAGMNAAVGVITMEGGATSHAAVVARSMNKPCITGVGKEVDAFKTQAVGMDGSTGCVWLKAVPVVGGKNPDVEWFRMQLIGSGGLLVTSAPHHNHGHVCLDLSHSILRSLEDIGKLIEECSGKAKELSVMVLEDYERAPKLITTFMTKVHYIARVAKVRAYLDNEVPQKFAVIGWKSKTREYTELTPSTDLQALVLMTKSGYLSPASLSDTKQAKAFSKVVDWLKADGIDLKIINGKGGLASWTVHCHG